MKHRRTTPTRSAFPRSRRSRRALVLGAAVLLPAALLPLPSANAGSVSAVDYAQCANGAPPSTAVTCTGGWLNGILQSSNSHFRESEVTPQRLQVKFSTGGEHSVTLRYQTRKGGATNGTHAYDALATWNTTVTNANRCAGLLAAARADISCGMGPVAPTSTLAIPADGTDVGPSAPGISPKTSDHHSGGEYQMYGGELTGATAPTHDNAAGGGDDYATTTITFNAPANKSVQLLFGGHLAASPLNRGGWGPGLGSSNINGGPYHIKWAAADGASVGNRDNQIMGSSIQPLAETRMSTTPSITTAQLGSGTFPASVTDTANMLGGSTATGTVNFYLYGPFAGAPGVNDCTPGALAGSSSGTLSGGSATSGNVTTPTSPGTYQWVASYAGDSNNAPANGVCGDTSEQFTITKGQPTLTTLAATPATVGTGTVSDTATVSGGYSPSGTVSFSLYGPSPTADCSGTPVATTTAVLSGGTATGTVATPTVPGTYYWVATLPEGTHNLEATHPCGANGETLVVNPATPTGTSTQALTDRVVLSGFGTPTGNVTFTLWSSSDCTGTAVHTSTVALVGGAAESTASPFLATGTYYWKVTYAGDANNAAGVVEACGIQRAVITNS